MKLNFPGLFQAGEIHRNKDKRQKPGVFKTPGFYNNQLVQLLFELGGGFFELSQTLAFFLHHLGRGFAAKVTGEERGQTLDLTFGIGQFFGHAGFFLYRVDQVSQGQEDFQPGDDQRDRILGLFVWMCHDLQRGGFKVCQRAECGFL